MTLKLKSNALLIAAGLLSAQTAFAGSLAPAIEDSAVEVVTPSAVDWSGFYAGATAGYLSGSSLFCQEGASETCEGNPQDFDLPEPEPEGNVFGLTGGYNWQNGPLVYGVEADISKANADGSAPDSSGYGCGGNCQTDILAIATLRGRVGYALDKWLPYATAGVGAMQVEVGFPDYDPATLNKDIIVTPVIGLGVEYMASEKISLKLEALHFFEKEELVPADNDPCGAPCGPTDIEASVLRFGVNYHF
ncbi:outer membrane protein [Celeribacter sp. PS-C1]|uniref:outer membrane protein n=1 Tax=Celeribacter sp. PS-C1 TaxID=2820813 RepID=UPI001CA56463|nr:outer membrane beta-barrel protein [Celeribacter sp. PS-C1]MBW6416796.1 outer membrane beta-barrel protein [Celeribacter sp. PS-C1]